MPASGSLATGKAVRERQRALIDEYVAQLDVEGEAAAAGAPGAALVVSPLAMDQLDAVRLPPPDAYGAASGGGGEREEDACVTEDFEMLLHSLDRSSDSLMGSMQAYEERERRANPGQASIVVMRLRDSACQPRVLRPLGVVLAVALVVIFDLHKLLDDFATYAHRVDDLSHPHPPQPPAPPPPPMNVLHMIGTAVAGALADSFPRLMGRVQEGEECNEQGAAWSGACFGAACVCAAFGGFF